MNAPVAFFVFNRPRPTELVFTQIARARPPVLFLIADGPRPQHASDMEACQAVRRLIERIDWPCRVMRNYSDTNLGCARRGTSGLDWVFENVEACIILEDDCVPSASFFAFCEQLLERYAQDERIMHINGFGHQIGQVRTEDSYYFSRFLCSWGWASWRRAWRHYDFRVRLWPALRETDWLSEIVKHPLAVRYFQRSFDLAYRGELSGWDAQWTFASWSQTALSITPRDDLTMNVGFGADATHTKTADERLSRPPAEMSFPLRHPACVVPNGPADAFLIRWMASAGRSAPLVMMYRRLPAPVRRIVRTLISQPVRQPLVRRVSRHWAAGERRLRKS